MANINTASFDELVSALKEMNEKVGSLSYYLFAIKYGKFLKNQNLTEIIRSAGLTESMSKELSKGLRIYNILSNNDFGLELKEQYDNIVLTQEPNKNLSLAKLADVLYQMESDRKDFGIGATATAFGFKYGKSISVGKYSCGSIIDEAKKRHSDFGLTHTHDATIKYGVDLYQMFENSSFGLRFSESSFSKNYCNSSTITNNKQINYLTALRTKPFMLLAGISGTGKSRIVRKLAQATVTEDLQRADGYTGTDFANDRWTLHSPANFELIQVKPNWHNSMDVIGYLSNIPSPHYVFTPFIEFIVKAWQHPEVPFFLCLDEMNLAPVEEYFAEFLSAIESRSFEGKEYMTDPIIKPFNSFGEDVAKMMVNTLLPNFTAADKNSIASKLSFICHFIAVFLSCCRYLGSSGIWSDCLSVAEVSGLRCMLQYHS